MPQSHLNHIMQYAEIIKYFYYISDCNWTRTHNHLLCNWTLSHLANGWVFIYELSGCGFESHCSHLNFRYCACFEQRVPWHSCNYRVWIHSETHMWHERNIQSTSIVPSLNVYPSRILHFTSILWSVILYFFLCWAVFVWHW